MSPRSAEALALLSRAGSLPRWGRGRPLSKRTSALLALVAAGLTSVEIAALRGTGFTLVEGRTVITLKRRAAVWSATLPPMLAAPLMAWLTESRLWGEEAHLFSDTRGPLTPAAIRKSLSRQLSRHLSPRRRRCLAHREGKRPGPPAAVVNPRELLALWEGRGGCRPLSLRAIAARLGVSPPTAHRRLQALGAVHRHDAHAAGAFVDTLYVTRLTGTLVDPADTQRGSVWIVEDIDAQKAAEAEQKDQS